MVMEAGDVDLAKVLSSKRGVYDPFFTRSMWHDMLRAVDFIHQNRVVHSDLKPANWVLCKGCVTACENL